MDEFTLGFLASIIPRMPMLIVCVVGVAISIAHSGTPRSAAICAGVGFGLLSVSSLVGIGSQYWVMMSTAEGVSRLALGPVLAASSVLSTLASVLGLVMLMIAIFARRSPPATPAGN